MDKTNKKICADGRLANITEEILMFEGRSPGEKDFSSTMLKHCFEFFPHEPMGPYELLSLFTEPQLAGKVQTRRMPTV